MKHGNIHYVDQGPRGAPPKFDGVIETLRREKGELMKSWIAFFALAIVLTTLSCAKEDSGSTSFSQKLPDFSLQDPEGKTFTNKNFSKDGVVLVVTAPILKNESDQKMWNQYLLKAKAGSKAKLVYLEDINVSFFKDTAMRGMKKGYEPGKEPILLIDQSGETRRALNVPKKKTVVLVYDDDGELIYSETNKPSAQAAETIWKKINAE